VKRKSILFAAVAAVSLAGAAGAQSDALTKTPTQVRSGTYVLDPAHGKITWSVDHMGFSTYVGQFTDVSATLNLDSANPSASKLDATVRTASAGTFSDGLDKHLKTADFFDVAKHPTATFRATSIRPTDADSADIAGNLTLRGVTRPILIRADFNQAGVNPLDKIYSVGFDGHAKIKRSDFGINYGLPALGDEVTLHFEAEFKQK
jgi:polyisoprenoid-binding protein YceI